MADDVNFIEEQTISENAAPMDPAQIKLALGPASATNDGYLFHTDWINFNGKWTPIYTPENIGSKSTDVLLGGTNPSDTLYPSQKAIQTYINNGVIVTVNSALQESAAFAAGAKLVIRGDLL